MTSYRRPSSGFTYDPNNTAFWAEVERAQRPLSSGVSSGVGGTLGSARPYGDIDLDDDQLWTDQELPIAPIPGTGGGGGPNGGNKLTDIDIAADKIEQLYGWGRHASDAVIRQGNAVYLPAGGVSKERQMEVEELPGIGPAGEVPEWARRLGNEVVRAFPDFLEFWKHASDAERDAVMRDIGVASAIFITGIGNAMGLAADFNVIAQNPDSRTLTNVGRALVELLPGVPSIGQIRKLRRVILNAARKGWQVKLLDAAKQGRAPGTGAGLPAQQMGQQANQEANQQVGQEHDEDAPAIPGLGPNGEVPEWAVTLGEDVVNAFPV